MKGSSSRHPVLLRFYRAYLDDHDVGRFIQRTAARYTQPTLARLAEHSAAPIRRGAVLALGYLGDFDANPVLGCALLDRDRTVRILAESGIRRVWARAAGDPHRREVEAIIRLNAKRRYREALRRAGKLVTKCPGFAEAWNQRSIARFGLGQYAESIRDSHQALELNPYHFAAAAGMGQAYVELGNPVSALECFRRALRLNRDLEAVRVQVARLSRLIEDK